MAQIPKPTNNQKDNKNSINIPPLSSRSLTSDDPSPQPKSDISPVSLLSFTSQAAGKPDSDPKPAINMNTAHSGQQFKLASTEVQGPKPPLVPSGISKYALIAAGLILLVVFGAGGYYFYTQDNNPQPTVFPLASSPVVTPIVEKNLDSDKDGLPDTIEKVLGTYMTKADTDGDGYNDLQEIKSGYSPLIIGSVGKYSPQEWDLVKGKIKIEDREFYEKEFEVPVQNPSPTPAASLSPNSTAIPNLE